MEFEFVENFYDTIKSRARVAALRKNTNVLEADENIIKQKKRKTIRRNNLKNKAKTTLKGKAKVRRRKTAKESELTPTKRRASVSNKKTPSPKKKLVVPACNNDIDEAEAAYILCNLSTISQRSFDSFYSRFPSTADNKIEIPIFNSATNDENNFSHCVAFDQPYSHILLDHNYWSATNQPEIRFEVKVEPPPLVSTATTTAVSIHDDRPEPHQQSIGNDVRVEIKHEPCSVDIQANKIDIVEEQSEVNNNLLAESLSIVKHEVKEEEEAEKAAEETATAAKALTLTTTTTTKVKQKKVVKKKEKCRKILSGNNSAAGKKKTQNRTIKKRKEKKVSLLNGFTSSSPAAVKKRTKSHEKVVNEPLLDVKKCESPLEVQQQQQNHDKVSVEPSLDIAVKEQNGNESISADEESKCKPSWNGENASNGHEVDDSTHQQPQKSIDDDDEFDDVVDEKSWTLISDFHGTILDKLTSKNVRFCGDMQSDARSTATLSSSSSSGGVKIFGSINSYQTAPDSRNYESNDYYASHRPDYNRYDPVTNCEYRRPSYASYRSQDPRTNNYPYNFNHRDNNRHRKEHFHRHHSYSEGINNQQTYASYKAQKTYEQRQMPSQMMDAGNPVKQNTVSVFELPVMNGASSIVKDLLPIIERKELLRSKSVADPRLAPTISDSDKFQNPKKKLSLDQYRKRLSSTNISEDISRESSNQTQTT